MYLLEATETSEVYDCLHCRRERTVRVVMAAEISVPVLYTCEACETSWTPVEYEELALLEPVTETRTVTGIRARRRVQTRARLLETYVGSVNR